MSLLVLLRGKDAQDVGVLLDALTMDLTAIRNNSRSTAGDPWKRLKGNVGRAEIALKRIQDYEEAS